HRCDRRIAPEERAQGSGQFLKLPAKLRQEPFIKRLLSIPGFESTGRFGNSGRNEKDELFPPQVAPVHPIPIPLKSLGAHLFDVRMGDFFRFSKIPGEFRAIVAVAGPLELRAHPFA
ncbi:MAG TPA: hypothetical protein VHO24_06190, partial [Opitutaceae bacterium]|nr:hypothetical protein [Opitutaceae bacterium]